MTYTANIEEETLNNTNYRKVLYTGKQMQLVVMTLQAGEDIPEEVHEDIDQFFRVEEGTAMIRVEDKEHTVTHDEVLIVPGGTKHYVKNVGDGQLKLYSIYTPPEHPDGTVHATKAEADAYEEAHH